MQTAINPNNIAIDIQNVEASIEALKLQVQEMRRSIMSNLNSEYAEALQVLKDAILQSFSHAKVTETQVGWTVSRCPEFKNLTLAKIRSIVKEKLNNIIEIKIDGVEAYDTIRDEYRYKTIEICLTKGYARKSRPDLRQALDQVMW
jgi:hypothetical protein